MSTLAVYLQLFRKLAGRRVIVFTVASVLAANIEAVGIALFLPLLSQNAPLGSDSLSRLVARILALFHLPPNTVGVLPVVAAAFLAKGALTFLAVAYQYAIAANISAGLRREMVRAIGAADYRYLLSTNTGKLSNVVAQEVTRATSAFIYFTRLIPLAINIGIFFLVVAWLNWRLTLTAVVAGLVVLYLLKLPTRLTERYSNRTTQGNNELSQLLIQTIQANKYLRATNGFPRLEKKIDRSVAQLAHDVRRIGLNYALTFSISQPLVILFLSGILLYYHLTGNPVAPVLVTLLYLYRIMTDVFQLQGAWQEVCGLVGGLRAAQDLLADLERHREPSGSRPFTGLAHQIELRDVSVSFGEVTVLERVSLTIPRHQTVAFVGESGAGKSTLVDTLSGVLKPNGGEILFDGIQLSALDLPSLRERVGYVPQDCVVFDDSIANNISLWSCDGTDAACRARITEAARRAACDDFILATENGYDTHIGERGVKLSGGQRQRLAIAKELFKRPEILILDEATSALDSESERAIQRSVDELRGQMTIVVIAHRLSTIRNVDRIFVLKEGALVEEGSFAELMARSDSRFRKLAEAQNLG